MVSTPNHSGTGYARKQLVLQNKANATWVPKWLKSELSGQLQACEKGIAITSHPQSPKFLLHSPSNKLFPKHIQHTFAPSLLPLSSVLTSQHHQIPIMPTHPPSLVLCLFLSSNLGWVQDVILEISTSRHFRWMEAGSELKINKPGKFMGKKNKHLVQKTPSRGTEDVNLNPWVYSSIITHFNSQSKKGADKESLPLSLSCPRSKALLWDLTATAWQQNTFDSSTSKTPLFALTAHSEEGSPNFHVHSAQSSLLLSASLHHFHQACRWLFPLITTESSSQPGRTKQLVSTERRQLWSN